MKKCTAVLSTCDLIFGAGSLKWCVSLWLDFQPTFAGSWILNQLPLINLKPTSRLEIASAPWTDDNQKIAHSYNFSKIFSSSCKPFQTNEGIINLFCNCFTSLDMEREAPESLVLIRTQSKGTAKRSIAKQCKAKQCQAKYFSECNAKQNMA